MEGGGGEIEPKKAGPQKNLVQMRQRGTAEVSARERERNYIVLLGYYYDDSLSLSAGKFLRTFVSKELLFFSSPA